MTPEELETYNRTTAQEPQIHVGQLNDWDHTLVTGYNSDGGGDVHAYVMDGMIHVVTYRDRKLLHHAAGDAMWPIDLRPGKRAYPHTTDLLFAMRMRNAGEPLTFLGHFDWDTDTVRKEMAARPFKAPTHLSLSF